MLSQPLMAQTDDSWEDLISQMEQQEDAEATDWEETSDVLSSLAANPIDINLCTREDLQQLPFLSAQQVMDIMEYRDRAGRIETPIELRLVPSLEKSTIDLLQKFIVIRPDRSRTRFPSFSDILRTGRHELVATANVPFYTRRGDRNGYLGYKYKHWLRYNFTAGQHVKAAVIASQDAGEPFFSGKNATGYDFYSAYIMVRQWGRVKAAVIGRYRLRFGLGLILNNSFGMGKLTTLASLGQTTNRIYGHSSRSEANYLQGGAATVTLVKGLDLTAFASWRKIDTTPVKDSAAIATILKSGYHRTESEMQRRRNASASLLGGNLNFFSNGWHVGITAFSAAFDKPLQPNTHQAYRRWQPRGKQFWNASIDYGYLSDRWNLSGETATGDCGQVATINTVSCQLSGNLAVMALQRYYPYRYYSLYSRSFADGTAVQDESGIYVGANWSPLHGMTVFFYTDYTYFPWPKYQVSQASHSWDNLLQVDYSHGRWALMARWRMRKRQRDDANKHLTDKTEHRGRMALTYEGSHWSSKTQLDMAHCTFTRKSLGWMVSENAACRWGWLSANATVGYFHTDDYDSRVYAYERGMLYNFAFTSFYGEGLRLALHLRADFSPKVMVMAKLGCTHYFDRSTIGTGLQQIDASSKTDLEVQLRLKL